MPDLTTATDALRHLLVTLSDRFEHVLDGAPDGFADFDAGADVRPPIDIVRHLSGLMRFAGALWTGGETPSAEPLPWAAELDAFRHHVRELDATLRRLPTPTGPTSAHRVLQGPLLDAVTHIGQLATLRRLAGSPVGRRRYFAVEMEELDATGP